jgi:hypothetical protein
MNRLAVRCILLAAFASQANAQLLTTADFESGSIAPLKIQGAAADSLAVVTSPVRAGRHAVRSLLRNSDGKVSNGLRAELVDHTPVPLGRVHWYGLSIYADTGFIVPLKADGILYQFHQQAKTGSPVLAFRVINGTWKITTDAPGKRRTLAVLPFKSETWTDWVIRVKWANDTTGEWTIWKDGVKVVQETNIMTTYAAETAGPYAKFGQYHTVDETAQNTVYFDEYKLAGPDSAYADVAPGGGPANVASSVLRSAAPSVIRQSL